MRNLLNQLLTLSLNSRATGTMVALGILETSTAKVMTVGAAPLIQHRLIMHVLLKAIASNSSLLYRNYYQLKYSWNFLKKVKWLSDIRQPFFDLLR